MDTVCLGELLVDMFPDKVGMSLTEVSAFRPKPGGAPANVAVAAARLCRLGALTSLTQGVIPALPTSTEVDEFLNQNGLP